MDRRDHGNERRLTVILPASAEHGQAMLVVASRHLPMAQDASIRNAAATHDHHEVTIPC